MDDAPDAIVALPDLIERAGLTPHGLAVKAAIPYVTLRRRLANPDDLRLGEVKRMATALGVGASDLLRSIPGEPEETAA